MDSPTFDRSGAPTNETLRAIEEWPANDPIGWLDFCGDAWNADYGKVESTITNRLIHCEFVTGGWSDNESLIDAMSKNFILWSRCWLSSHRGGLYVFEEPSRG